MKLKEIGLISHFPIWEFVNSPSPLVFVKIGDRQIDLVNCKRINGKFFHTKDAVFELDGEYENTMMGQPFYLFNLQNSKPISLRHIEKIQRLYRENNTVQLTEMLAHISEQMERGLVTEEDGEPSYNYISPLDAQKSILKSKPDFMDEDDVKFIINYKWFDMADLKIFNFKKISELRPDRDISKKIPTIIPMVMVVSVGIGIIGGLSLFGIGKLIRLIGGDPDSRFDFILGLSQYIPKLLGIFS